MITIIHGDDIATSRTYFQNLKEKTNNPLSFDGAAITLTDLVQIVEGGGLFAEEKSIFIESLLSRKKISKDSEAIISYLSTIPSPFSVTIWENKELSKTAITGFPGAQIKIFKLPLMLFTFLDILHPGNGEKAVRLFHQTRSTSEDEMIFFMLIKQFRLLLALTDHTCDIDEIKRMAPWQKGKLEKQSRAFSKNELLRIYTHLYEIDLGHKTGSLPVPLAPAIDFLLLSL